MRIAADRPRGRQPLPVRGDRRRAAPRFAEGVEQIDIGGPAMIRAAAKNHAAVAVAGRSRPTTPRPDRALDGRRHRRAPSAARLAAKAFARTAAYDAAIAAWLAGRGRRALPRAPGRWPAGSRSACATARTRTSGRLLRHRRRRGPGLATAASVQGKELSYNNLADADAALELAAEFAEPAVAIIKHTNPCGAAVGRDLAEAYAAALACDPVSAFGGIVACNRPLDASRRRADRPALHRGRDRPRRRRERRAPCFAAKPNLRLLAAGGLPDPRRRGRRAAQRRGGLLVQDRDDARRSAGRSRRR